MRKDSQRKSVLKNIEHVLSLVKFEFAKNFQREMQYFIKIFVEDGLFLNFTV